MRRDDDNGYHTVGGRSAPSPSAEPEAPRPPIVPRAARPDLPGRAPRRRCRPATRWPAAPRATAAASRVAAAPPLGDDPLAAEPPVV